MSQNFEFIEDDPDTIRAKILQFQWAIASFGWEQDLGAEIAQLEKEYKKSCEAYDHIYNYVGVRLNEKRGQALLRNEQEAALLFGKRVGTCLNEEYICIDSALVGQPLTYSLVAEDSDTFVLRFPTGRFLAIVPETCQSEMI